MADLKNSLAKFLAKKEAVATIKAMSIFAARFEQHKIDYCQRLGVVVERPNFGIYAIEQEIA